MKDKTSSYELADRPLIVKDAGYANFVCRTRPIEKNRGQLLSRLWVNLVLTLHNIILVVYEDHWQTSVLKDKIHFFEMKYLENQNLFVSQV